MITTSKLIFITLAIAGSQSYYTHAQAPTKPLSLNVFLMPGEKLPKEYFEIWLSSGGDLSDLKGKNYTTTTLKKSLVLIQPVENYITVLLNIVDSKDTSIRTIQDTIATIRSNCPDEQGLQLYILAK